MIVAVATHVAGFTTLAQILPAFVFHMVVSVLGLQMVQWGSRPAETAVEPAE